jgi:type I restriction enzyme S subunit
VKAGWTTKTLENCLERFRVPAKIQRKQFREDGAFPIVSQEADFVNGYWDKAADVCVLERPVVIFGDHTQVLKYVDFDFVVGADGVKVLAPKPFLDAKYLFYFVMANRTPSLGYARHYRHVKELPVSYPEPKVQQRIVAILDEAFEALARARAHAEANLQNARELFESYLAAAFSGEEAGWDVCELNEHVRFIDYRGKTPPKTESGIRLITAKNVKMGYIQREPEEFVLESAYEGWMTRGFPKLGDVLFTTEAPLANVAQLDTEETVVIGQRLITMQADQEVILPEFLKFSLMSPPMQSEIHKRGTGATVVGIKAKLLKTVPLRFPSNLDRQRIIAANCQSAYDNMERLEEAFGSKLQDIDHLRQSLLQKAFAGDLT